MFIEEPAGTVFFEAHDMPYVNAHGFLPTVEEVLAHRERTSVPFVRDTYQLAHLLHVSRRSLFRLTRRANFWYTPVSLVKKNGGIRRIHAPLFDLKNAQRRILQDILVHLPISRYATAYHPGARLIDNAAPHCGKRYLLKLDLEDFFPSIRFDQVYSAAFNKRYFPPQVGVMLTTICCREDVLPQGAPTSPALSNLVMKHFDDVMGSYCERQGLSYTRYCDDITLSGDKPLYAAYAKAKGLLEEMGFTLNERKTRFVTHANRQTVTGLTVNEQPHVSREYRRALRQELHYAFTYGVEDAIRRGQRDAFIDREGTPMAQRYLDHLEGRARYVLSVQPDAPYWQEACARLQQLRRALPDDWHYSPFFSPHHIEL